MLSPNRPNLLLLLLALSPLVLASTTPPPDSNISTNSTAVVSSTSLSQSTTNNIPLIVSVFGVMVAVSLVAAIVVQKFVVKRVVKHGRQQMPIDTKEMGV